MALEEYYESFGGDLAGVRGRLMTDERIIKFIKIFLQDPTYDELCQAMDAGDLAAAFRAAHTLKGVASNLGFTALLASSTDLAEALRPGADGVPADAAAAPALKERVDADYAAVAQEADAL